MGIDRPERRAYPGVARAAVATLRIQEPVLSSWHWFSFTKGCFSCQLPRGPNAPMGESAFRRTGEQPISSGNAEHDCSVESEVCSHVECESEDGRSAISIRSATPAKVPCTSRTLGATARKPPSRTIDILRQLAIRLTVPIIELLNISPRSTLYTEFRRQKKMPGPCHSA